jgi:hypothetical protein
MMYSRWDEKQSFYVKSEAALFAAKAVISNAESVRGLAWHRAPILVVFEEEVPVGASPPETFPDFTMST